MRSRTLIAALVLTVSVFCVAGSFAYAQFEQKDTKGIFTSGDAKVWIEPDRARVYFGIETMDISVNTARDTNAIKVKTVMDALKALSIEGMLMKAPSYNVSLVKENEYDTVRQGRLPKIIGYKVEQYFTVLLQNKDSAVLSSDAGRVIDTALNSGVNIIQNVEFFKEDDSADRRQALSLAVKNAMENAKIMAQTAGVSIAGYSMISSTMNYIMPMPYQMRNMQMMQSAAPEGMAGAATTLSAGKIAVNASATVRCEIQ